MSKHYLARNLSKKGANGDKSPLALLCHFFRNGLNVKGFTRRRRRFAPLTFKPL